ncbi:hypothetical protein WR164_03460 [Philodulcilactobacillus myokoensis]|uniref:Peptidase S11 D-alanyl-D-alanine carboxypeptidase A N-terminal domain-containing protein n=1 Tax=Philodulcilactobacillus myokoensis TaxID=2929573 RepID=A0A9W6AZP7_9LACO|nr:serine hydrolase [Philodulcilactobacillus myokoensis]GLB46367.1 hypothetical protein WR164_03460 [Philodulcilactobacillus myokoensis]
MRNKRLNMIVIGLIVICVGIIGVLHFHSSSHQNAKAPVSRQGVKQSYLYDDKGTINTVSNGNKMRRQLDGSKDAKEVVALDADTNKVIYEKNAKQNTKIASLAKLMTLYLVAKKVHHLHNNWNQRIDVTNPNLRRMSHNSEFNGGFKFKANSYTVRQLYQAAIVGSSDSSTIALGEWVAGSDKQFIQDMNTQAKLWHLNAHFVSASGLENDDLAKYGFKITGKNKTGNEVSALATAVISRNILKDHPDILKDASQSSEKVAGQILVNVNPLLKNGSLADLVDGLNVDGLKTGFTDSAGLCFVGTAHPKGKHRIILVVLNDQKIFTNSAKMLKELYRNNPQQTKPKAVKQHKVKMAK